MNDFEREGARDSDLDLTADDNTRLVNLDVARMDGFPSKVGRQQAPLSDLRTPEQLD